MTSDGLEENHPQRGFQRIIDYSLRVDIETLIFVLLILLAVFTRFYDLESRVMSHDESLHTYFSWQLEQGRGYEHTPMMHGTLQFHLVGLSYFLFGDSDASARIPAAVCGVLMVGMIYLFRRWLGRNGAIIAAALMVISPYMLYYSRYVRNEALVVPEVLLMFYAVFRYFEARQPEWLYLLALSLSLHLTTKETAFFYLAQLMIFIFGYFFVKVLKQSWEKPINKLIFLIGSTGMVFGGGIALLVLFKTRSFISETLDTTNSASAGSGQWMIIQLGLILAIAGAILASAMLIRSFGDRLRTKFPSFDLLIICLTMILPHLAALPATILGWDPLAYQDPASMTKTGITILVLALISAAIGLWWNWRKWLVCAAIFYIPFIVIMTTMFTNGNGLASGLVGSLGYWLVQHGEQRGSQPWYYYLLIQIPVYEYLIALGSLMAAWLGIKKWQQKDSGTDIAEPLKDDESTFPVIGFIGYWAITSILLFSLAGERMPWITVHMALPMILLSGWAIGWFIKTIDWKALYSRKGWLIAVLLVLFLFSGVKMLGGLLGNNPPFQGSELNQLQATSNFLASMLVTVISFIGLLIYGRGWNISQLRRLGWIIVLSTLAVLTARTAFRAAYINDDLATEYMVYAHSAPGVKTVMREVEDLSQRTKDGLSIDVGFDDDVSWPFTWYLRNYSQQHYFGANPTRELLDYPLIIVGDNNWGKIEPLLKSRYYSHEYNRMWWPMQDYWSLTFDRIWKAIRNPEMRSALWQIWFNRNYEPYGILEGKDFSLENWQPSDRMRLYIRKDIASLIWDYGVMPEVLSPPSLEDPYKEKMQELSAEYFIGSHGSAEGQFIGPRGIVVAADASLFIADSSNHRIQHLSPSGEILAIWGEFGDVNTGNAPAGTFNEPWGIAVAPDGSVYVADTWNHRIQHFTANGEFINMFGESGQGETLYALWGPREVAVDQKGRVFVSDTGNKRVVAFDPNGRAIAEIGGSGYSLGELDEPVGLAIGPDGELYIADTWNQRIQIFKETAEGEFEAIAEWPIDGWYGQSLDNKPYLATNKAGSVCATDPEGYRILCFDNQGEFLMGWGGPGVSETTFSLPSSLAFGDDGQLWVVDSGNNRVMQFQPDIP